MGFSIFEREIGKFLETQCCLVVHQIDLRGPRFTIRKTVDYVCCYEDGTFGGIEVKQTKTDSFSFARIREHQRNTLSRIAVTTNGHAFLALNFREKRGPGQAYLIPWSRWLLFRESWLKKSIRRREAEEEFREFALRRKTGGWEKQGSRLI